MFSHFIACFIKDVSEPTATGKKSAAAICVQSKVKSNSSATAEICLAWHMPEVSVLVYDYIIY